MNLPAFSTYAPLVMLWQTSWQTAGLLLLAFLLSGQIQRARLRARLWHFSLVCCALTAAVAALMPHYLLLPVALPAWIPLVHPADAELQAPLPDPFAALAAGVLVVWLAGAAFPAARLVSGCIRVRRGLHVSRPLVDERVSRLLRQIDTPANLDLRVLVNLQSPFCWQVHRPVLIVPPILLER